MSEDLGAGDRHCQRCGATGDLYDYPDGGFLVEGPGGTVYQLDADSDLCRDCHWSVVDEVRESGGVNETLAGFGGGQSAA